MTSFKRACLFVPAAVIVAAAIRLPLLAQRPMHGDEAVNAIKFSQLLEERTYRYDPQEYHGPTLYYFSLVGTFLTSADDFTDVDEHTLRALTVVFGLLLVLALLFFWDGLGWFAVTISAVITAMSPAFVFYSRYYIHEMLLVFFTFAVILCAYRYLQSKSTAWALGTGIFTGLMLATKETALIHIASMFFAVLLLLVFKHKRSESKTNFNKLVKPPDLLAALFSAVVVVILFYSSFFTNPQGLIDFLAGFTGYFDKAVTNQTHSHPWYWYLAILTYHTGGGELVWTEGVIVVLALFGFLFTFSKRYTKKFDCSLVRFIAFYTFIMTAFYSAIPYKTPWSMLSFFHGMILLAGIGASVFVQIANNLWRKIVVFFVLIGGVLSLTAQSLNANFLFYTSLVNPYVYAHPTRDVFDISQKIHNVAELHPRGSKMYIQLICPASDYWPLPWYLRDLENVGYWDAVDEKAAPAPLIIASDSIEPEVLEYLYDKQATGQKSLYVPLFEKPVYLRPDVELRGYITKELLDRYQQ